MFDCLVKIELFDAYQLGPHPVKMQRRQRIALETDLTVEIEENQRQHHSCDL